MNTKVQGKAVLVAMTGGVESTVAAYLLKKQGYRPIGIALQLFEPNIDAGPFNDMIVGDMNKIKSICTYLDIPFYAINAVDIFKDKVVDPVVGRVLSGQTFEPIVFYMKVVIEVMMEKAQKFNTNLVATGHYAKVLKNQKTGNFELMVSNEIDNDQSYVLARLDENQLSNLMLPLSEIRKVEVQKIGELLKVEYLTRSKANRAHIMHDPRMKVFVEQYAPKDLRRTGNVYHYSNDSSLFEHSGIHKYYIGQNQLQSGSDLKIDPELQVVSIVPFKGNIFVEYPDELKYKHALILNFQTNNSFDFSKPREAYIKLGPKEEKISCRMYFKNSQIVFVEFNEERKGLLIPGQLAVFYSRSGDKGKVLGSGILEVGGMFDKLDYNTLPKHRKGDEDEVTYVPIIDKFSF